MNWTVVARPQVQTDILAAALWYDSHSAGLGGKFVGEIIETLDSLERSPLLSSRKHPSKNIRWRYPKSCPYRVVYEVINAL